MHKLEGKIALVTGGSSGIGLATARQFVNSIDAHRMFRTGQAAKVSRKFRSGEVK